MKNIDADYYGYRDEDDGVLVPLEKEAQKEGRGNVRKYICGGRGGGGVREGMNLVQTKSSQLTRAS